MKMFKDANETEKEQQMELNGTVHEEQEEFK